MASAYWLLVRVTVNAKISMDIEKEFTGVLKKIKDISWFSDIVQFPYVHEKNPHHMHTHCYRSVALRRKLVLTNCKASVSHTKEYLI